MKKVSILAGSALYKTNPKPVIRLEWLHAKAALDRWREECVLLQEEARRLVAGFQEDSNTWTARSIPSSDAGGRSPDSIAGYNAFVARQAWVHQCIAYSARHKLLEALPVYEPDQSASGSEQSESDAE